MPVMAPHGHRDGSTLRTAIAFTSLRRIIASCWLVMLISVAFTAAQCQGVSATTPPVTDVAGAVARVQIPQTHIYNHLFRYILHLESLRPEGDDNPFMKDIAERELEMNPPDWALVQAEAHKCEADIAPIDAQAHALIASIKNKYPGGKVADISQIPKPPEQLISLQQQHDLIIRRHIDNLQRAMSKTSFARLDNNLQTRFASKIHGGVLSIPARSPSEIRQRRSAASK